MKQFSPAAVALSFVDCINRSDHRALVAAMSEDHQLEIFNEPPVVGRAANAAAWIGYLKAFPNYAIHPRQLAESGGVVAILGHTIGSHLRLSDVEESKLSLIWVATVENNLVTRWRLVEDTPRNREECGLTFH